MLPAGWEAKKDASGRTYFIDHATKATSWTDPRPLPMGFEARQDNSGRTYYVNHSTRSTTWTDPRTPVVIGRPVVAPMVRVANVARATTTMLQAQRNAAAMQPAVPVAAAVPAHVKHAVLQHGSYFTQYMAGGTKQRNVWLTDPESRTCALWWGDGKAKVRDPSQCIPITSLRVFEKGKARFPGALSSNAPAMHCFSLITNDNKSLHIQAPTQSVLDIFTTAITWLSSDHGSACRAINCEIRAMKVLEHKKQAVPDEDDEVNPKLEWYKDVLRVALLDRSIDTEEQKMLMMTREKLEITTKMHNKALDECGWSLEEYSSVLKTGGEAPAKNNASMCAKCGNDTPSYIVMDCFHLCLCSSCAKSTPVGSKCPVAGCGQRIKKVAQTFS